LSRESLVRGIGLFASVAYAATIGWLFINQPRTVAQATGGLASIVGAYSIDQEAFADGLKFFRKDEFIEARSAFGRADPAERDARTQFYIAYSYYREGWGRVYDDRAVFAKGLAAVDKAIALAPGGRIVVDDPDLGMHSADELRGELQRGIDPGVAALNPLRVLRTRK
jgi:hypothetical protein